jgi:hypothetical protein
VAAKLGDHVGILGEDVEQLALVRPFLAAAR